MFLIHWVLPSLWFPHLPAVTFRTSFTAPNCEISKNSHSGDLRVRLALSRSKCVSTMEPLEGDEQPYRPHGFNRSLYFRVTRCWNKKCPKFYKICPKRNQSSFCDSGSVGKADTWNTRGPLFESCHWQYLYKTCFIVHCWKDNREKSPKSRQIFGHK